ncbi:MAG: hypothetical protein ACK4UT_00020 [Moraxellaceae bacterium]
MLRLLLPSVFLLALGLAQAAPANKPGPQPKDSRARWFRYYDANNQPTVMDRITEEHIIHGYEALDSGMRLLEKIPPQRILTPEEMAAAREQRQAALQRSKDDKQLLRLYSRPVDAEQARDRQIDALQLRIDYNNNSLLRLRESRAAEAQRAALFERKGRPVPEELQKSIATLDRQIQHTQQDTKNKLVEQERIRQEFAPIIQRLSELTGIPVSKTADDSDAQGPK